MPILVRFHFFENISKRNIEITRLFCYPYYQLHTGAFAERLPFVKEKMERDMAFALLKPAVR